MAKRRTDPADRPAARRRWLGVAAGVGSVLMMVAGFLGWVGTDTEDGGDAVISGWGTIGGDSDLAGTNLNDILDLTGSSTYRPGLLGLILGAVGLLAAVVLAASAGGRQRPHRITAAVLAAAGLGGLVWGLIRGLAPGDAGILEPGEGSALAGPWLTAAGGLILTAVAVAVFAGAADATEPVRHRGIQR